jgi:hypothetical protein
MMLSWKKSELHYGLADEGTLGTPLQAIGRRVEALQSIATFVAAERDLIPT